MTHADNAPVPAGQSVSLAIIGGGVMGLFAALVAGERGVETMVLDAGALGQGASHGLIGALMPHTPDRWSEKKQFQFDALTGLEPVLRRLEAETGLSTGFRRTGRLMPLGKPHLRDLALRHAKDAATNWQAGGRAFAWQVLDDVPEAPLFAEGVAAHGFIRDTLAARLSPRALMAVLEARLKALPTIRLRPGQAVTALDPLRRRLSLQGGETLAFDHAVVANGHAAFPLIEEICGTPFAAPLGQPVKGQSARLAARLDPEMPVIFRDGLYVIAHDDGTVAVGSTSEDRFDDPHATDEKLEAVLAALRALIPALADAPVLERWAGLRPKAIGRDPMAGPLPGHPGLHLLTGGFKISFGLAHRLAEAVIGTILEDPTRPTLPTSFSPGVHLALARGE